MFQANFNQQEYPFSLVKAEVFLGHDFWICFGHDIKKKWNLTNKHHMTLTVNSYNNVFCYVELDIFVQEFHLLLSKQAQESMQLQKFGSRVPCLQQPK